MTNSINPLEEESNRAIVEANRLRRNIALLLNQVSTRGVCRGCGAEIFWITTKNAKLSPHDIDGTSHFATCPKGNLFRKGGSE